MRTNNRNGPGESFSDEPPGRPLSIGLALGGGAARGFAHVGVLRTLIANGIYPDVIAGTSIGAVVGGLHAAGKLDEFEAWARSLTRRRIFGYLDFSLSGSGLIGGARLANSLVEQVANVCIEDLPVKMASIATEIGTGHEIWLTRGRLADALSASYALPGIFPPVRIGGRWLMDGALVNPVPISAARACGARLVIAVNLNSDNFGRGTVIQNHGADAEIIDVTPPAPANGLRDKAERILRRQFLGTPGKPGFSTVMVEAFYVMQDRITRARLAGDPPDVLLNPKLGSIGFFDFHRADEAIAIGIEATERSLDSILEAVKALS
ncbi:MAG TPA: patatin-like phospholipase family protein [Xanthobacteraceae bacterium]|nr:patatin-like phospholipase family protein [Xanthobacteraceae bacterium]